MNISSIIVQTVPQYLDEFKCSKDDNVTPHIIDKIRREMFKHQEEIEKQKAEAL